MRLTYELLKSLSYKQLIKAGFSEKQILTKLSKFYLKEQRQLIINEEKGLTIERALRQLKKGKVDQGNWIIKTALNTLKKDIADLQRLSKYFGKNSFANDILRQYQRGEINIYKLHNSMYTYSNNLAQYETKEVKNKEINILIDSYNPDLNPDAFKYTYSIIKSMYE